jgi:DNA-binding GntR family transcriptional regulator
LYIELLGQSPDTRAEESEVLKDPLKQELKQEFKRETLVDKVADCLRNDILRGVIPANQRILVSDLVQRFSVSHIPIREAFRRLEAEGLLEGTPHRGMVTRGIALDELAALYDLRKVVEGEYACRSVAVRTPNELDQLRALHCRLEVAETAPDPETAEMWSIHRAFHWAILAPAATPCAQRIFDELWRSGERYMRLLRSANFDMIEESVKQHRQLLEACERGNGNELRALLEHHLTTSEQLLQRGYCALQQESAESAAAPNPEVGRASPSPRKRRVQPHSRAEAAAAGVTRGRVRARPFDGVARPHRTAT